MRNVLLRLAIRLRRKGIEGEAAIDQLREALDGLLAFEALTGSPALLLLGALGEAASDALLARMDDWLTDIWIEAEGLADARGGGDGESSVSVLPPAGPERLVRFRKLCGLRRPGKLALGPLAGRVTVPLRRPGGAS